MGDAKIWLCMAIPGMTSDRHGAGSSVQMAYGASKFGKVQLTSSTE